MTNTPETDYILRRELTVPRPLTDVFDFFSKAENLEKLTPAWLNFRIDTQLPIEMREGALIHYQLRVRGLPLRWITQIEAWDPPFAFVDVQMKGPYKIWHHTHLFRETPQGTQIEDIVRYTLPFGPIGRLAHWAQVSADLKKIFDYRQKRVLKLIQQTTGAPVHRA